MLRSLAGDLWQMRNAKYLSILSELREARTDHFRNAAAHTAVYFIEHHCGDAAAITGNYLDSKAHARQLAAGSHPRQRL